MNSAYGCDLCIESVNRKSQFRALGGDSCVNLGCSPIEGEDSISEGTE